MTTIIMKLSRRLFSILGVVTFLVLSDCLPVDAASISGTVTDLSGATIAAVDLDLIDQNTGIKLFTPGDNTNSSGFFSISVLPGLYIVTFDPPSLSHYVAKVILNVDLTGNQNIDLSTVLDSGIVISGKVIDQAGQPVGHANIDVDSLSGGRVRNPNDTTDLTTGNYWMVVPSGGYRMRFDPPAGTRLRGAQLDTVFIDRDTTVNITLLSGSLLSGQVTSSTGTGLNKILIDLRETATGAKVYLSNHKTDTLGFFSVAVPTGLYTLRFTPPVGSFYVAAAFDSLNILGDLVWNQLLDSGSVIDVFVHDSLGNPVANANLDFKLTSTTQKLFTPNDKTDATGHAFAALLPNIYDIQINPPLGTAFDRLIVPAVTLNNDTSISYLLPEIPRVQMTGTVIDELGTGVPGVKVTLLSTVTGNKAFLSNKFTDSLGQIAVAAPIGNYVLLLAPPQGSRLVGRQQDTLVITANFTFGSITLIAGNLVSVKVLSESGAPVVTGDFDFKSTQTGVTVYTPFDNTDVSGIATVAIPSDNYSILFDPLLNQGVAPFAVDVDIRSDTSLLFIAGKSGSNILPTGFVLLQNFPNPFNGSTNISYIILENTEATLAIYNALGQRVKVIASGAHPPTVYNRVWDGKNSSGQMAASGIYFARLTTSFGSDNLKMILLK